MTDNPQLKRFDQITKSTLYFRIMRYILNFLSYIYGNVIRLRHWLYDRGLKKSLKFDFPVIVIGNIEAGGTGKTPMVIKLTRDLKKNFNPAILSRGYGRKGSDFLFVEDEFNPILYGDEPSLIKQKLGKTPVAVFADRITGISLLIAEREDVDCIILDDALQHRALIPGFSIMLISCQFGLNPSTYLPFGNKRDSIGRIKESNAIIITKCPQIPDFETREKIRQNIHIQKDVLLYFCGLNHGNPESLFSSVRKFEWNIATILICGVANPTPLLEWLINKGIPNPKCILRKDHHIFTERDLHELERIINMFAGQPFQIVTTEKDGVKLKKLMKDWSYKSNVYVVPVEHDFFDKEEEKQFLNEIETYVRTNKQRG